MPRQPPQEQEKIDRAIAILEDVLARCRKEDVRDEATYAARKFLEERRKVKWPFEQFRKAIERDGGSEPWEVEGRRQVLNASLNGVRRAVAARRNYWFFRFEKVLLHPCEKKQLLSI